MKERRIVDFHTHTFPDKMAEKTVAALGAIAGITPKSDGTLQGLIRAMDDNGVDLSVILPVVTRPEQFQSINNFAVKTNEAFGDRVISFGGIHPASQNYKKELDYIKSLGLKGIKLHPDYQGVMIDDMRYKHIIDYASELDLVIVVHAGIDIGLPNPVHCPPQKAAAVIDELRPLKLVLAHMGGWKQWQETETYLVGKDVYFDCAFCSDYLSSEQFGRMVKNHGANKILFATDSPWDSAKKTLCWMEQAGLNDDELQKICGDNADKLLGYTKEKGGL